MTTVRPLLSRALGALALCVAVPLLAPAAAGAQAPQGTVDLIVRRDAGLDATERADLRADAGVRFERRLRLADTEVVTVPPDRAEEALTALEADPDVRWAQRDGLAHAQAVTTDPSFGQLWGLRNTGQVVYDTAGTADADMDVPEAWARSTGAGVTVAIVDTGVDAAHPDLQGQLAMNAGEIGAGRETNGVDDDHDGLTDNWRGYDFEYRDSTPDDLNGHGSHVAGTIAARNGNGVGITGLAPDAKILPLKALGDNGSGSWSSIMDAFDYAGDIGVRVVNASLGAQGDVPGLSDVIAQHPNTLYVVSAGNDDADLDVTTYTPCEIPRANVLCVGASDSSDAKASFSNHSPVSVDVFAPGVLVLSTRLGEYWYLDGTSMASPHVAGEAALLVARYPSMSAVEVKDAIMRSAEPKAALADYGHDGGRANAQAALALVASSDGDGDGVADGVTNCPDVSNPTQADADGDGAGDLCDVTPRGPDADGDGAADIDDNCPQVANVGQRDTDSDGLGDACDATPHGPDTDGDGVADADDVCPLAAGATVLSGCPEAASAPASPALAPGGVSPIAAQPPEATSPAAVKTAIGSVRTVATGKATCRAGRCTRIVSVAAALSAGAKVTGVTAQAKVCARGRCIWRTVTRSRAATVKLPAGAYRLTVTASGPGGRTTKTIRVTVRRAR
jgi:thermitase